MTAILEKLRFGDVLLVPGWLVAKPDVVGCILLILIHHHPIL